MFFRSPTPNINYSCIDHCMVNIWFLSNLFLKETFILYWSIAINNAVIVSGTQQKDSAIHVHVYDFQKPIYVLILAHATVCE